MFELNEYVSDSEYRIELKTTNKDEFEAIKRFVNKMLNDNSFETEDSNGNKVD